MRKTIDELCGTAYVNVAGLYPLPALELWGTGYTNPAALYLYPVTCTLYPVPCT
jgi:hypothetical protein